MKARACFLACALLLTACSSHTPYYELGICLADTVDMNGLKSLANQVASRYELKVDDYSISANKDLKALDSSFASEHLFALLLEDERWRSTVGLVMINNIGTSSRKAVRVSLFRNHDLFGSDQNTDRFRRDFISAVSDRWKIIDASNSDGTYHECGE